ncbi:hypothetical protein AVEN_130008-1 [Araneus ventricosus]|uniref:Uncharacterized protein n=1 Tax=Araneus ventricosus TaxID=182803 RepID=A0A4Y2JMJ3_ARAVE|nr:hypothetical protein AVEN_130008-1 [Araneus ventricosus]
MLSASQFGENLMVSQFGENPMASQFGENGPQTLGTAYIPKPHPCPLSQFQISVPCSLSSLKRTLFQISVPSISKKKKKVPGRREAIRRKRLGMLSDGVILLHDNTHTARKSSSGKSDAPPPTWDPNTFHSFNILCSDKCLNRFGDNEEK